MDLDVWKHKADQGTKPQDLGLEKMAPGESRLIGSAKPFRSNFLAVFDGDPEERSFGLVNTGAASPRGIGVEITLENTQGARVQITAIYARAAQFGDELIAAGRKLAARQNGGACPQPPGNLGQLDPIEDQPFLPLGQLGAALLCEGEIDDDAAEVPDFLTLYLRADGAPGKVIQGTIAPQLARALGLEIKRAFRQIDKRDLSVGLVDLSVPLHKAVEASLLAKPGASASK